MTYEDVIREIYYNVHIYPDGDELRVSKDCFRLIIESLDKQLPLELSYFSDGYADGEEVYDMAECPTCGHKYDDQENDWKSEYCPYCGQHLDWSEV